MSIFDKMVDALTPPESDEQRAEARSKARAAATPGDWLSLLLDHHEQVEAAFAAVRAAGGAEARKEALKALGTVLNGHSMAEEAVVYPALADVGSMAHADMAYTEQVAAKMQMAALEKLDPLGEDFTDKLGHLEGAVQHHVYKEESDWFLDLKEKAPPADQQMVLKRYREEFDRYMRGGEALGEERIPAEPRSFASRPQA